MTILHRFTFALLVCAAPIAAAQAPRQKVLVIGTGGTIGSAGEYWTGNPTRVPIDQLVKVPGIDSVAIVESEQLWNVGSGSIGPARWLELSRHIADQLRA